MDKDRQMEKSKRKQKENDIGKHVHILANKAN